MKITERLMASIQKKDLVFYANPGHVIRYSPHVSRCRNDDYSTFLYDSKNCLLKRNNLGATGLIKIELALKLQTL